MKKLKFLIIGTNFISDKFSLAAKQLDGVELCAVYSRKTATGADFAKKYGIERIYTDLDEALLDKSVNAVYVASPTFLHKEHSIKAMRAGKHVLCEKSIALSCEELSEMRAASLSEGRILLEAMRPAFDPAYKVIRGSLSKLGRIRNADLRFCQYSSRYDKFKQGIVENAFDPTIGNSALSDIGVYPLWLAISLFGAPKRIASSKVMLENGFLGMGVATLTYADFLATVTYSKIHDGREPSVIEGEDATLIINKISETTEIYIKPRGSEKAKIYSSDCENNMIYEIEAFGQMINGKKDHLPYLDVTEEVMKVADHIHASE